MNQFTERYKLISNSELLIIIENTSDYQPEAVEAAKNELEQRQLTDQELKEAKTELEAERQEKDKQTEKVQEVKNRVKKIWASIADTINPIQYSAATSEKLIKLIVIVFGLISVYQFYNQFGILKLMFSDIYGGWDLSTILFLVPLFMLPTSIILFWLRKKTGWILLGAYLTYSALNAIGLLIMTWNLKPSGNLFPQTEPVTHIVVILFFGGTLWTMCKENLREQFSIDRKLMFGTVGITAFLTILSIAPYFQNMISQ